MLRQYIIVYYFMYLHTNDMESREEAEEKHKKHMSILEINMSGRDHIWLFPNMERGPGCCAHG
jgi:hypothetical protein